MDKRTITLKEELELLKKEELDYQFIKEFICENEKEFEIFKQNNSNSFLRLKKISDRIRQIEWLLLTEEGKKKHLKYLDELKNKFQSEE